jgi:hypothetical protein
MHFANLFLWLSLVYGFGVLAVFLFLLVRGIYFGFVILFTCGAIFNCLSRILFCLVRPEEDSFLQLRPIILSAASGLGLLAMLLFLGGFASLAAFLVRNPNRLHGTRGDHE